MSAIGEKVAHVKRAGQTREHACHWPGCTAQVPPAMWGCKPHWYSLPKRLRDGIWASYRHGQESSGRVSREYVEAAKAVQDWITAFQASQRGQGHRPMKPKQEQAE
jgi:hypothetical protein